MKENVDGQPAVSVEDDVFFASGSILRGAGS